MDTNVKSGTVRLWVLSFFILLFLLSWLNPLSAQPPENSPALSALQKKASRDGSVRIIVQLDASFTPEGALKSAQAQQQRQGIAQAQAALLNRIPANHILNHQKFNYTPLLAMEVTSSGLQTLMVSSGWTQIQEDKQYRMNLSQSAPLVGSTLIQSQGFGGAGQTIAIIDTGVDANHPFLSGKVVAEACFSTTLNPTQLFGSTTACPNNLDTQVGSGAAAPFATNIVGRGHGTHVAGIAAGGNPGIAFTGVAPQASLIAIQAFSIFKNLDCGGGKWCAFLYLSDGIAALEHVYSLRNTFNIASVNMSFGGGAFSSPCDRELFKLPVDLLRSAQIASISSSGNESSSFALSSPACISSVVSVGSTTKSDTVSSSSNSSSFLDLLAPGQSIQSSVPGSSYAFSSGTSMASPHVAGAWAVMKEQISAWTVSQILANLKSWGVPVLDTRNGLTKPRLLILLDTDGDSIANIDDTDDDNDGVPDTSDAFPLDPTETKDSDGDGVGDNADAFPNDPTETTDTDGDGVGDNADDFPDDPTETTDTDGDGVGDNADAFPNDPNETVDTDGDGIGDNSDPFPNAPAAFELQGIMSGTKFCEDVSGTSVKEKFKDEATFNVDLSGFPTVAAQIQMTDPPDLFTLTGMALLKNPKSGVLQLFGDDENSKELALSGSIKLNKKTQVWVSLKGKFQLQDNGDPVCTLAGKFKAK
jgi:subtilisin